MPRTAWAALVALALTASAPARGAAQGAGPSAPSGAHAAVGATLEWFVPTAGYAYGGAWSRGILPNAVRVGGVILFAASLDDDKGNAVIVGQLTWIAGTIWAVAGAALTSSRRGQPSSGLMVAPSPWGGTSLGIRWAIP